MGNSSSADVNIHKESSLKYQVIPCPLPDLKIDNERCQKCNETLCPEDLFTLSKCKHSFCQRCLCEYLRSFNSARIICPVASCKQFLPDSIIRKCLSTAQIELYDQFCLPDIKVKCLIKDCTYYVAAGGNEGHFMCLDCKQPNCIACSNLHSQEDPCGVSSKKVFYESEGSRNLVELTRSRILASVKESSLTYNSEHSECEICSKFLLPRSGILIVPCMHNYCRDCLKEHLSGAINISLWTCPGCSVPLKNSECIEIVGDELVEKFSLEAVKLKFFTCQTPDCTYFFDKGNSTTFHICPTCLKKNCISCEAVHEGKSCEQFKQSTQYLSRMKDLENAQRLNVVNCYNCNNSVAKNGGCAALKCNNCSKQICAFSGKSLGPQGCNCRKSKKCHKDCDIGCRPEGNSEEEIFFRNYYHSN